MLQTLERKKIYWCHFVGRTHSQTKNENDLEFLDIRFQLKGCNKTIVGVYSKKVILSFMDNLKPVSLQNCQPYT